MICSVEGTEDGPNIASCKVYDEKYPTTEEAKDLEPDRVEKVNMIKGRNDSLMWAGENIIVREK